MDPIPFTLPNQWPVPYDNGAADRLVERFQAIGDTEAALLTAPGVLSLLRCLGGNSPYLAELALREAATLRHLVAEGPDAAFARSLCRLDLVPPSIKRPEIAASLRQAKREIALIAAIADIGQIWPLEAVTGALTQLAEATLKLAIRHLHRAAHDKGAIRLRDPDRPDFHCGFVALGMGKLGAVELNYSSDIDLILLYDASAPVYASGSAADGVGSFTSRMARDLVGLDGKPGCERLRLSHRSPPASRSRRHATRGLASGRADLLRKHGPELGKSGHDQGPP